MGDRLKTWDELREGGYDYEPDASYYTWMDIYRPVYSKIKLFNENFNFNTERAILCSSGAALRIAIPLEDGSRIKNFVDFIDLAGDTDFGETFFKKSGINHHRLDNYSPMPKTGSLNLIKGQKSLIDFIKNLDEYINKETSYKWPQARSAYWSLFERNNEYNCPSDDKRYNYCYNVCFYGISENDNKLLFNEATAMIESWINCQDVDNQIIEKAKEYWALRRKILSEVYKIHLDENGQKVE